jgi:sulfur-carrier protein adenylyltransferase/sulfurtransferase
VPEPDVTTLADEITPIEVAALLEREDRPFLLDVREANEWEIGHLPGAVRISVNELSGRMNELDTAREMVVYCRSGVRSRRAIDTLRAAGFRKLKNMTGGILRWSEEVDPSIPQY